jgi:peptide/nickel transport system substrate-binding protein
MYSSPSSLSLIGKSDRNSDIARRLITDSLVQYDADLDLVPMLATSWDVSPDGLTVSFELRRDVRWHDGSRVTADDVVFSVAKARDPSALERSYLSQFEDLVSLEALGEHRVRAVYSEPYADFLEAWTLPIIPAHLAGIEEDLLAGEFARNPVGCGPFRFVRYEEDIELVLEANPDYWMGRPALDGIRFEIVPNERTAYQALLRGDVDFMGAPPDIWREALASEDASHLGKLVFERMMVWYIAWNLSGGDPLFDDAGVRRAMMLALDREPFIEKVLDGLGLPATTTYHPSSPWAAPDLEPIGYDPDAARRLLEEAGWIDRDGDGIRDREGRRFSFTLLAARSSQEINARIVAWVQQSLREVGVEMEIEILEWGAFRERRGAGRFDAIASTLGFTPIADQSELYHSSAREAGFNFFGLDDPTVDALLERGRVTFDPEARAEIYHELQRRLDEIQPIAAVFHFSQPVLYDPRLTGLEPSGIDLWRITPGPRAWSWTEGP